MIVNKNEWERSFGPWAVRRCDVYVVSFVTPGLVDLRLDIAKDLWKAGINADLVRLLHRHFGLLGLISSIE
jgi:translation initiation factor 2-alpha kinase 4